MPAIVNTLRADLWNVTRLDDIRSHDGGGPRLLNDGSGIIYPDLEASKRGHRVALEVKRKAAATFGRLSGELEHGIDRVLFDNYLEYEHRMDVPTFVIIVEEERHLTFIGRIKNLRPRLSEIRGDPVNFIPCSQFRTDWVEYLNRHLIATERPAAWSRDAHEPTPQPTLWD